ncbi:polyketide biosynthesis enoyl-CoA hydratase [Legionella antarctica]|uniref:Polyketide biosynthesis enoyl-CoA hydratase n=1 Tax=Legionella antarctica TaxID=2708020 RepID=A0A6F8T9D2_9GAMM|nr:polyketide synthase [Legionella antarctica]BCA96662.1 polyketide biosynthesis enoyl-CoA hydratase [Legionella antarctica]
MKLERIAENIVKLYVATEDNPYIDQAFFQQLKPIVEEINHDDKIAVVIMCGTLAYFSAGASQDALQQTDTLPSCVIEIPEAILNIKVPTIASMEGHGIGGGLILGLLCDMAMMAEESLYGANFISMGFTPGMGSTQAVTDAFGPYIGRKMLFGGQLYKGQEFKSFPGCTIEIMPKAEIASASLELAKNIAMNSRAALTLLKGKLSGRRLKNLKPVLDEEIKMHRFLFADPETQKMINEHYLREL